MTKIRFIVKRVTSSNGDHVDSNTGSISSDSISNNSNNSISNNNISNNNISNNNISGEDVVVLRDMENLRSRSDRSSDIYNIIYENDRGSVFSGSDGFRVPDDDSFRGINGMIV